MLLNLLIENTVQHWYRVLNPSIVKGPWSPEEQEKLLKLVKERQKRGKKISWAKIAEEIEGRTDAQVCLLCTNI